MDLGGVPGDNHRSTKRRTSNPMWHRFKNLTALTAALAAVLAIGAQAASASQPTFEAEKGSPVGTTLESKSEAGTLETAADPENEGKHHTVSCKHDTNTGTIKSSTEVGEVHVAFTECTSEGFLTCTTNGQSSGTITTNALVGTLYYIGAGNSGEVGLDLEPESGGIFATFTCEAFLGLIKEDLSVEGSVVGELSPPNVFTETATLTLNQSGGQQSPEGYLDNSCDFVEDVLFSNGSGAETFTHLQSGESTTDDITLSKKVKVNAPGC